MTVIIAGICKSPRDNQGPTFDESRAMTFASLKAMADLLGGRPILRVGDSLHRAFPTPTTTDFDFMDHLVETAVRAGWRGYLDCAYPPAWATEGKGAYVASVEGSSCQILAQWGVPRHIPIEVFDPGPRQAERDIWIEIYHAAGDSDDDGEAIAHVEALIASTTQHAQLTNSTGKIARHFIQNYRAELGCAQAWNIPEAFGEQSHGGIHVWGEPKYVEQDKLSAPRPHLLSAAAFPHIDPKAAQYMGETLADRYGVAVDFFGVGINEPDIRYFFPLIMFDIVNGGDGGDTIRDRLIPEYVKPFIRGLEKGFESLFALQPVPRRPLIVGPNVAFAGTLPRFAPIFGDLNVMGDHYYANEDDFPASSYADAKSYAAQAKAARLPHGCSEFGRASQLTEWLRGLLALGLDPAPLFAIFYDGERFIPGWGKGGTEANDEGRAMSALLHEVNGRRRAVGKP